MNFTIPGGPTELGPTLARIVRQAEDAGIHSFWPMDHFFQIPIVGAHDEPMLEGYATLAWAAGLTQSLQLGTMVSGVHYRHPGLLIKLISTIDVLSGGRAWLGIGAAWNEQESRGLGVPFPPLAERFERLEETLRIARQMFDCDASPFDEKHYQLDNPLNVPAPIRRPPILIGGMGERKTLRLVAKYGDACNLFEQPGPGGLEHKLAVLRQHCEDVGRPYDEIVKTTTGMLGTIDIAQAEDRFTALAEKGIDLAVVDLPDPTDANAFDFLAQLVERVAPVGRQDALP